MALHCHQPVGNFDYVFDMGMKKCYQPILDLLNAHQSIRVGLHFSGPLLEWMEQHQSDSLDLLTRMVERGQIELLSGGFFEPLLASIPIEDAKGQIQMMNSYITRRFGFEPTGFWLTERVWDPCLPLILEGTGMIYTIVDDTHLFYSGLKPNEIYGPYITEKEGHTLRCLATPMIMRYLIPFKPVEEVITHLKGMDQAGHGIAIYGDDGEKFGLWPGTYDWVIRKGWLEKFFTSIEHNGEWLRTVPPGEYISSNIPLGRIYLPQASYEEMTEWALPADQGQHLEEIIGSLKREGQWEDWRPFVRGGIWDSFLVKYDESNRMHKKMLFLSKRAALEPEAREHLWRAQCNCAYWHGIFGGLYLGHLRRAIHESLIRVQKCLVRKSDGPILYQLDLDKDGAEEVLVWTKSLSIGIDPQSGGGLFEICHLPKELNLSDTLTRRPEAYHNRLNDLMQSDRTQDDGIASIHDLSHSTDGDLESSLIYDNYTKISLLDHFLGPETTLKRYVANEYLELGDFVQGRYDLLQNSLSTSQAVVELSRTGFVGNTSMTIKKGVLIGGEAGITVSYGFECLGPEPVSGRYGCEFNLTLYSDQDKKRYYFAPETGSKRMVSESGKEEGITAFELVNRGDGLTAAFEFSSPVTVWFFPIMTVSQSEGGFERTYQGTSLLFLYPLELSAGEMDQLQIRLHLMET